MSSHQPARRSESTHPASGPVVTEDVSDRVVAWENPATAVKELNLAEPFRLGYVVKFVGYPTRDNLNYETSTERPIKLTVGVNRV